MLQGLADAITTFSMYSLQLLLVAFCMRIPVDGPEKLHPPRNGRLPSHQPETHEVLPLHGSDIKRTPPSKNPSIERMPYIGLVRYCPGIIRNKKQRQTATFQETEDILGPFSVLSPYIHSGACPVVRRANALTTQGWCCGVFWSPCNSVGSERSSD